MASAMATERLRWMTLPGIAPAHGVVNDFVPLIEFAR